MGRDIGMPGAIAAPQKIPTVQQGLSAWFRMRRRPRAIRLQSPYRGIRNRPAKPDIDQHG
jgi:hypothetical protein